MIANLCEGITKMKNGEYPSKSDRYCLGRMEFWLVSEEKKKPQLVIYTDEHGKHTDNYLVVRVPDHELDNLAAFFANVYARTSYFTENRNS